MLSGGEQPLNFLKGGSMPAMTNSSPQIKTPSAWDLAALNAEEKLKVETEP